MSLENNFTKKTMLTCFFVLFSSIYYVSRKTWRSVQQQNAHIQLKAATSMIKETAKICSFAHQSFAGHCRGWPLRYLLQPLKLHDSTSVCDNQRAWNKGPHCKITSLKSKKGNWGGRRKHNRHVNLLHLLFVRCQSYFPRVGFLPSALISEGRF